jgi:Tol biopolymer transport system component
VRAGDEPSFSPDGKLIAFEAWEGTKDLLTVVPVTGGPERVVAEYDDTIHNISWSGDGKWIFVLVGRSTVERVPAAGGPSEKVISTSGRIEGPLDGRISFYRPDGLSLAEGRMAFKTASGESGEFSVPPGSSSDWSAGNYPLPLWLLTRTTRASTAHIVSLAEGATADLVPNAAQSKADLWSPNGLQVALHTGTAGRDEITVLNADGSQPRRYPVGGPGHVRWSPNGDMLAHYGALGYRTLAVLDLSSGKTRAVYSAGPNEWIPDYMWRADGKAIVLVKHAAEDGNFRAEVHEAGLDGTKRKLRDIGAEFPSRAYFISDRLLVGGTASERFVIPTRGGGPQKLPGTGRRGPSPGVSGDGRSLLFPIPGPTGRITSVELMTSVGESVRTLNLPFEGTCCWHAPFHPDGRHLILGGRIPGESESKIFLVPLNGDAPRVLSQSPRLISTIYISPDGKSLVFTSEGAPTSTIYELDMTALLQSVVKR